MIVVGPIDQADSRELRRSVLRPELAPDAPLPGDELTDAVHLGVRDSPIGARVLSTCFIYPESCPWRPEVDGAWHLRQMATLPGHRSLGYGAMVVAACVDHLTGRTSLLWCNAREPAVPFYLRNGFSGHGQIFTDERHTIPHLRMWRPIQP
jgi:GNAT superfamily N-acetyltransferase